MLTFAVAVAHAGQRVTERVKAMLELSRPDEVPFEPMHHRTWTAPNGSVVVAGWNSESGNEAVGRHWHEAGGGLTALTGNPWPRSRGWRSGESSAEHLAAHLVSRSLHRGTDDLLGVFTLLTLNRSGAGTVAADPFGLGHVYWGSNSSGMFISSRASLAARLLGGGSPRARRDPVGAGWLAFCECLQGLDTPFAGVEVLRPDAHIEIIASAGAEVRPGRARPWKFAESSADASIDVTDEIRNDIAMSLRRALDVPAAHHRVGLTGGRDSRTILAVMLEEGIADAFEFETFGAPDLPDVLIATTIAEAFGLRHRNGWSNSAQVLRSLRAASIRARGHETLSERELSMRLKVGMSCGMQNVMNPFPGHPALGDEVLVSGYCGEGLRTNYSRATWVRRRTQASEFPFLGLKFGAAEILKPDALDHYRREIHRLLMDGIEDHDEPRDIIDAWYLRNRFRRWMGPDHEFNANNDAYPLYSTFGIRAAHQIDAGERWADRVPYDIIRRACPPLVDMPFADAGWSERLQSTPPQASRTSPMPNRAPRRQERSTRHPGSTGGSTAANRVPAMRTVVAEQRHELAAVDTEIMERYLGDSSNPLFEVVDQRAVLDQVAHFERLPEASRRQLYGALTAAIWLGEHELTYPSSTEHPDP